MYLLTLLIRSIPSAVAFFSRRAWVGLKNIFGAQLSVKDYSLDHLRGRYYVNAGENIVFIEPDMAFAEDLRLGGAEPAGEFTLRPYDHCWVSNNYIIVYTSDEKPADMRICFDHASLKKLKRELRQARKKAV